MQKAVVALRLKIIQKYIYDYSPRRQSKTAAVWIFQLPFPTRVTLRCSLDSGRPRPAYVNGFSTIALPIGLPNAKCQTEQTLCSQYPYGSKTRLRLIGLCSRCSAVDISNAREASHTANRIRTARRAVAVRRGRLRLTDNDSRASPTAKRAQRSPVRRDCRALHGSFCLLALAVPGIAERLLGYGVGDGDAPII